MRKPIMFRVLRDVTQKECTWLLADVPKDTIVYECLLKTFDAITPTGTACTFKSDGTYPFIEIPTDALSPFAPSLEKFDIEFSHN